MAQTAMCAAGKNQPDVVATVNCVHDAGLQHTQNEGISEGREKWVNNNINKTGTQMSTSIPGTFMGDILDGYT